MVENRQSELTFESMSVLEDPFEKLTLIDTVQGKRDWSAVVYAPSSESGQIQSLNELKTKLDQKGVFSCLRETDLQGREVLRIHRVSIHTSTEDALSKLGVNGVFHHTIEKVSDPIIKIKDAGAEALKYVVGDPARRLAAMYAIGDLTYFSVDTNYGDMRDTLVPASGFMGLLQSMIYIIFARDGNELELGAIRDRMDQALRDGKNPLQPETFIADDPKSRNIISNAMDILYKHPIEIGSGAQILGQLAMIAAGGIGIHKDQQPGGWTDIGRGFMSIAAWSMLSTDAQHTDIKTPWAQNPFARAYEEFREAPHIMAGVVTTGASASGMASSALKNKAEEALAKAEGRVYTPENKQMLAEVVYVIGDLSVFFTEKSSYGEKAQESTSAAAKAVVKLLQQTPILMSESHEQQFVQDISHYLARKNILGNTSDATNVSQEQLDHIEEMKQSLVVDINKGLAEQGRTIHSLANALARMTALFPEHMVNGLLDQLTDSIISMHGVAVEKQELLDLVHIEQGRIHHGESSHEPPSMSIVGEALAEITFLLPPVHMSQNATLLFDNVRAFMHTAPAQEMIVEHAFMKKAAENLGMPLQEAQQFQKNSAVDRVR